LKFLHKRHRDFFWYGLPSLLSKGSEFLLIPVFTRILTPREFGIANVALVISGLLRLVAFPGVEGVYLRYGYTHDHEDLRQYSKDFRSIFLVHIALAFLAFPIGLQITTLLMHRFAPDIPVSYVWVACAALVVGSFQSPWIAKLRIAGKVSRAMTAQAVFSCLSLFVTSSCLIWLRLGAFSLIVGDLCAGVVLLPFAVPTLISGISHPLSAAFQTRIFRVLVAVGPESVALWTLTSVDRLAVNYYRGPEQAGLYTAAYQFGAAIIALGIIANKQWGFFSV
jgi:O-antigen/teichoic acid export membrane protein